MAVFSISEFTSAFSFWAFTRHQAWEAPNLTESSHQARWGNWDPERLSDLAAGPQPSVHTTLTSVLSLSSIPTCLEHQPGWARAAHRWPEGPCQRADSDSVGLRGWQQPAFLSGSQVRRCSWSAGHPLSVKGQGYAAVISIPPISVGWSNKGSSLTHTTQCSRALCSMSSSFDEQGRWKSCPLEYCCSQWQRVWGEGGLTSEIKPITSGYSSLARISHIDPRESQGRRLGKTESQKCLVSTCAPITTSLQNHPSSV